MREVDLGKGYERFLSPLTRKMSGVQFPLAPLRDPALAGVLSISGRGVSLSVSARVAC